MLAKAAAEKEEEVDPEVLVESLNAYSLFADKELKRLMLQIMMLSKV